MKKLFIFILPLLFVFVNSFAQTRINAVGVYKDINTVTPPTSKLDCANNNGITVITTGSTSDPYSTPNSDINCTNGRIVNGNLVWTGNLSTGFVTYNFSQPLLSATISYTSVNGPWPSGGGTDIGQIVINGGGTLTLANPCGVTILGDVLTCNLTSTSDQENPYGDISITVNSTCPFTSITLFNIGEETGWVQGNPCRFQLVRYNCAIAPILSTTTLNNNCPATTANLSSITASNLIACNSTLTWHTATPATLANTVTNPNAVGAGTYYASFFNQIANCYSATTPVTVTIALCCLPTLTLTTADNMSNNTPNPISLRETSNWIRATNVISLGNNALGDGVVYHSGNFVELNPGFEATIGSQFSAYPENCTSNFVYKSGNSGMKDEVELNKIRNDFVIYPNPSTNFIEISMINSKFNKIVINSFDGKTILDKNIENSNFSEIDVSNYSNGIYIISVTSDSGEITSHKFIKN
jgi:Secretion system C-terminal sorting domain